MFNVLLKVRIQRGERAKANTGSTDLLTLSRRLSMKGAGGCRDSRNEMFQKRRSERPRWVPRSNSLLLAFGDVKKVAGSCRQCNLWPVRGKCLVPPCQRHLIAVAVSLVLTQNLI